MILVVLGPTAVGKTKLSIELAKKYNAVVVNADSVQIYKYLNIGSGKIKEEEKENIPHFLFDIKNPNEDYNVKDYQKDVRDVLNKYKDRNIVLVGGTGLYISAALYDYEFADEKENHTYDSLTNEKLFSLALKKNSKIDIHPNNRRRLIRFLTKEKVSTNASKLLYDNVYFIGLTTDRDKLYDKISQRVDQMIKEGLLEEAKNLFEKYPNSRILASAIGYKEFIPYFEHRLSLEEVISNIKQNSRHYAKRQYTWFNNKMNVKWFDVNYEHFNKTLLEVEDYINKSQ